MATTYQPTLEDIAHLAKTQPEKFSSATGTLRSIENVMGHDPIISASTGPTTINNHYDDYLKHGGDELLESPIPKEVSIINDIPSVDSDFKNAACDCESNAPCCIKTLIIGCDHKSKRISLPEKDDKNKSHACTVSLIADKQLGSGKGDKLKATFYHGFEHRCGMVEGPYLLLEGNGFEVTGREIKEDIYYDDRKKFSMLSDYKKVKFLAFDLFDSLEYERLAQEYKLKVVSCEGAGSNFGATIKLYPHVQWKGSLSSEMAGTIYSNPIPPKYEGKISLGLEGVYDSDIFKIEVPLKEEGNESANAQDMMPLYKKISGAISNKLSFPRQDIESDPTQSYIKINQAFNVKDAGFKIVELDDKNDVGIEGKIKVSFDPILGVEINVDIVDAVLTALKAYPALSGISSAIKKARSRAALGVSTADGKTKARFHAGINLTANSKVTAEYTVSKVLSEKKWKKEASGSGVIGLEVRAVVKGEGETYFIKGSFEAEGKAKSELELKLSGGSGKNYNAKCELEFNGIKLEYKAKASLGGPRGGISKSNGGEFVVLDKSSLGSFTI
ncbi:MAG: hypothetical protein ACPHZ9_08930 [Neptunomonas phycophila]